MKKFLAIIAIASFAVACNNSSEKKADDKDTTKADTTVVTPAPADTTTAPAADTTAKAAAVTPETNAAPELSDDILKRIGKASAGIKDDLLEIKGIGEKLAEKLYELGIVSFEQMSRMDDYAYGLIDAMLPAFKGRAKRDEWAKQAKKLIKSKTTV